MRLEFVIAGANVSMTANWLGAIRQGQAVSRRSFAHCEEAVLPKPGGVEPDGTSSGLKWMRPQGWNLNSEGRLSL